MGATSGRQFLATLRYELKLIFRDTAFRGLCALWQLAMLAYALHYGVNLKSPVGPILSMFAEALTPVLAMVGAVYTVHCLRRPGLEGAEETFASLPIRPGPALWGKAAACTVALGLLVGEFAVLGGALGWSEPEVPGLLAYTSLLMGLNLALAMALAFWASAAFGRATFAYPAAAGGWAVYTYAVNRLVFQHGLDRLSIALNFPGGAGYHRADPLWGAWPDLPLVLPQAGFMFAGVAALLALAILAGRARRERGFKSVTAAALLGCLLAAQLPARAYLRELDLRLDSISGQLAYEESGAALTGAVGVVAVDGYRVELELRADRRMEADAQLTVRNPGAGSVRTLAFVLNGVFEVTEVHVDGVSANWGRGGHRLTVDLPYPLGPQETAVVTFHYRGMLWVWNRPMHAGPTLVAGTWAQGSLLPAGFAWYPQPDLGAAPGSMQMDGVTLCGPVYWTLPRDGREGWFSLGYRERDLGTVPFELVVHHPSAQAVESNLPLVERVAGMARFAGLAENGCYILGGQSIVALEGPGFRVVGPATMTHRLEVLVEHVKAGLDFLARLGAAADTPATVTVVTGGGWLSFLQPSLGGSVSLRGMNQIWVVGSGNVELVSSHEEVFADLLRRTFPRAAEPAEVAEVREAYVNLVRALFLAERYGEAALPVAEREAKARRPVSLRPAGPDHYREAVNALFDYFARHGREAAFALCAGLYPLVHRAELDLAAVLEAVGGER